MIRKTLRSVLCICLSPLRVAVLLAFFLSVFCCAACVKAQPRTQRKTLPNPAFIEGYPCAKGYAWFYADGHLYRCFVSRETQFGEATIPSGSEIALTPDGKPAFVQMSRNAEVHGYLCAGGGWLGVAEGAMVSFYPSGKLLECLLAADQFVQGVPCSHGGFWNSMFRSDPSLRLRQSGRLASCKLSRDFGSQRKGERFCWSP